MWAPAGPPPQEPRALSGRARSAPTANQTGGSALLRTLPLQLTRQFSLLTRQCKPPREKEDHGGHCLHSQVSPPPRHSLNPLIHGVSRRVERPHTAEEVSEVAQEAATLLDSLTTSAWSNTCKNRPLKNGEHREEQVFQTNVPGSLRERRRVTEQDPPGSSPTQGLAGKRP